MKKNSFANSFMFFYMRERPLPSLPQYYLPPSLPTSLTSSRHLKRSHRQHNQLHCTYTSMHKLVHYKLANFKTSVKLLN